MNRLYQLLGGTGSNTQTSHLDTNLIKTIKQSVKKDDIQQLDALIRNTQNNLDLLEGNNALHLAVELANENLVKALVGDHRIDINARNDDGETPLGVAVNEGQPNLVKILLANNKVNIDSSNKDGNTPLINATMHYLTEENERDKKIYQSIVNALLQKGASKTEKSKEYETYVSLLQKYGKSKDQHHVLQDATPDELRDSTGPHLKTALHRSFPNLNQFTQDILPKLKEAGLNDVDGYGNTIMHYSCDDPDWMQVCVDESCSMLEQNNKGDTALHCAIQKENDDVILILLEGKKEKQVSKGKKGSKAKKEDTGETHHKETHQDSIRKLVNIKNKEGKSPFEIALEKNQIDLITKLLKAGAHTNQRLSNGNTPLQYAILHQNLQLVDDLLTLSKEKPNIVKDEVLKLATSNLGKQHMKRIITLLIEHYPKKDILHKLQDLVEGANKLDGKNLDESKSLIKKTLNTNDYNKEQLQSTLALASNTTIKRLLTKEIDKKL